MSEEVAAYNARANGAGIRRETRLPYDAGYVPPNPMEIRELFSQVGLTGSTAGARAGVDGRTIRKWTGGEREIPYSAWRLLLIWAGLALGDIAADRSGNHERSPLIFAR